MKNIFKIYFSDLKKIFSNRVAIVIILAICVLPSLYARFYLKSSRDPYGNTKGIKVAIVNNDEGTIFEGSYINIGNGVVDELKENENIGRVFVDEDVAQEGTRLGHYYANIVIESGFSQKLLTFLEDEPQNPQLIYTVNEKINAIVPKITDSGTSTLKENIEKQFKRTVDEVVMSKINEIGLAVKSDEKNIYSMIDMVHKINKEVSGLDSLVSTSINIANKAKSKLQELDKNMPEVYNTIDDGQIFLQDVKGVSKETIKFLDTAPSTIESDISDIKSIVKKLDGQTDSVISKIDDGKDLVLSGINILSGDILAAKTKVTALLTVLNNVKSSLEEVSSTVTAAGILIQPINKVIAKLEAINNKLDEMLEAGENLASGITNGVNTLKKDKKQIQSAISNIDNDLEDISDELDRNIIPGLRNVLSELYDLADVGRDTLNDIEGDLPDIQQDINSGIDILDTAIEHLQSFQKDVPTIKSNVSKLDNELQSIKNDGLISDFLSVALLDPERFADFFNAPIELVENKLFSIPNYGSAMSPFFTVLAIWVGSLLLMALFTTRVRDKEFEKCKDSEKFRGKRLFFLTISFAQGLIVSLGEIIFLGVYVENLGAFILTTLLCSIVFSMITYSCVTTFGNSGKAILIIFLVLQLSGSGGTFPVEMSDPFFQAINPYLPFTYAIKAMREAVGGVVPQAFYIDLIILFGFFGVFAIMGLLLKPLIAEPVAIFDHKFSESELGEH